MPELSLPDEVGVLNGLLQCELSSFLTYRHVLDKLKGSPGTGQLSRFVSEHEASAEALRQRIRALGGRPVDNPGIWGRWSEGVVDTDRIVGTVADLDALKQEEQQSAAEYRRALSHPRLSRDCRELIECSLLPRVELHLELVNQLLAGAPPNF